MKYVVTLRDKTYEVEVEAGEAMILDEYEAKAPTAAPTIDRTAPATPVAASFSGAAPSANVQGTPVEAPLPGNVLAVNVAVGDAVSAGDVLLLIEAMKMENEVVASADGVVKAVNVTVGQMVNTGDPLVVL